MPAAFAALFACAFLAHQLWWGGFATWSPHGALVLAALWCLGRPSSVWRVLGLAAAAVVVLALDMPQLGDHELLLFVAACGLLVWASGRLVARRPVDGATTWAVLAPFLRVAIVVLYAAAALAKLNTGFLDPATSCAAGISRRLVDADAFVTLAVYGTIATEASLALLLAFARTRRAGLVLGLGFHALLALAGNVPFAVVVAAFYVAFLPAEVGQRVAAMRMRPGARTVLVPVALAGAWLVGAAAAPIPGAYGGPLGVGLRAGVAVVLLGAAALLAADGRRVRTPGVGRVARREAAAAGAPGRRLHPVFAVAAVLLVLNAASPYLGLKTEASFAMYSNLQTAPGHFNHLLVPERLRVFGAQDELVRVVRTPDPRLRRFAARGTLMVRFELERYLRANPRSSAWVVADGASPGTAPEGPLSAATVPAGGILDRLVNFMNVSPGTAGRC